MKTIKDFFFGTIMGFLLGGLLGLLLTPHSGDKNRQLMTQKYSETTQKIQQAMREKQEELTQEINSFSD
jgi:gas vesicle protein